LENQLRVGINYPWIDYAWDFGDPPAAWVGPQNVDVWREKKRSQIVEDFRAFAGMGLFAVRWFMLADGLSYGTGNEAPRKVNEKGQEWVFDPLPFEHHFHQQLGDDFEFVLRTCAELNLQFLPSLIDFHWCHQGKVVDENAGIIKGGRADIVSDQAKCTAFLDNVLEPLLDISSRYHEAIYAWELINEPEWVTQTRSLFNFRSDENRTVTLEQMREFIAAGIGRINDRKLSDGRPAFLSTVGFAHWDAIEEWDAEGLGITLHQFHYYAPDQREIPLYNFPPGRPCLIGEFATTYHRGWPELRMKDLTGTISARLQCIGERGYPAAFLWSARATDEATTWTDPDRQEMISFINPPRDEIV
jgi:hypothetical protein